MLRYPAYTFALGGNFIICSFFVTILLKSHFSAKAVFVINKVKRKIKIALKNYKDKYIIKKIPVVSEVVYGRKVGYKIRKINLAKEIENISATKIRKRIK